MLTTFHYFSVTDSGTIGGYCQLFSSDDRIVVLRIGYVSRRRALECESLVVKLVSYPFEHPYSYLTISMEAAIG